jgi:hypothetical protein
MTTAAKAAFKTKVYRYNGATWDAIPEVRDITGPGGEQVTDEATSMDSGSDVEHIGTGLNDNGSVTFQMPLLQDNAIQALLHADQRSGTPRDFRIVYPSATKRINFTAIVKNITNAFPVRGTMMHDVTLLITGEVSRSAHS